MRKGDLTLGQVLWALSKGNDPSQLLIDRFRYLRQHGIPFETKGRGTGNRRRYSYQHLVEMAVANYAILSGMKPSEVASYLINNRPGLRRIYRRDINRALEADDAVTDRNSVQIRNDDVTLHLHDRFSNTPGKLDWVRQDEIENPADFLTPVLRLTDGQIVRPLHLSQMIRSLVALARQAPRRLPGPQ